MCGLMTTQMKPGEQSESSVVSDGFDFRYEIDLGSRHCVQVNAYTLRRCEQSHHGVLTDGIIYRGGGASRARDWVLEGSLDGVQWTTLHEHKDDKNLEATDDDYGMFTWKLAKLPGDASFQKFRLRMTKPAHDGDWYFAVSGVEFYGKLISKT